MRQRVARASCAALVAALIAISGAGRAAADDLPRARALLAAARADYLAGRFQRAIERLERARAAAPTAPIVAYVALMLGVNRFVLGQRARARAEFERALRRDPNVGLDPAKYKPAVVSLFRRARERCCALLSLAVDGPPVEVRIDGALIGTTPLRRWVVAGTRRVQLTRGRSSYSREIRMMPNVPRALHVTLAAAAPRLPARRKKQPDPAHDPHRSASKPARLWTWVSAGAAAATFVAAIAVWASALSDHSEYQSTDDPRRFDQLAVLIPSKVTATNALVGVGVVLAAASVALFFLEPRLRRGEHDDPRRALAPFAAPTRHGVVAGVGGRWRGL